MHLANTSIAHGQLADKALTQSFGQLFINQNASSHTLCVGQMSVDKMVIDQATWEPLDIVR
jgi:hypothetical protein